MPKVSVIVSTYNRPERLKKAVESVLAQTYGDWELLLVHDGPTNWPEDLPADDRIRRYSLPENFGNDTRPKNHGIMQAEGEYVAFLDDDNVWRPDHLAALVKLLEDHPETALVYGDRWLVDETGQGQGNRLGISHDFDPFLLRSRNYIDTSDVLVRKSALEAVGGFDERYQKYIDWNLWLRLAKAGYKFRRCPLILTDYTLHADMKSVRIKDENTSAEQPFRPAWDPFDCEIELGYVGKEPKQPRVAIFTLTYYRLTETKPCFESLYKTAGYHFTHVIVDNGSTDGTKEWLDQRDVASQYVIHNEVNKGISIASNQALDAIKVEGDYDIIVKVDNDCFFITEGWLAKMVEIWKSDHTVALSCYVQGLKHNPGGAPRYGYKVIRGENLGFTQHLGGICHFVDAHAYDTWRWPEDEFLHGMQDLEFSQHLDSQGYGMAYLENYYCSHGLTGTAGQEARYPGYFERRRDEKRTKYHEPRKS